MSQKSKRLQIVLTVVTVVACFVAARVQKQELPIDEMTPEMFFGEWEIVEYIPTSIKWKSEDESVCAGENTAELLQYRAIAGDPISMGERVQIMENGIIHYYMEYDKVIYMGITRIKEYSIKKISSDETYLLEWVSDISELGLTEDSIYLLYFKTDYSREGDGDAGIIINENEFIATLKSYLFKFRRVGW
jgi:hypothetical protein